MSPVEEGKLLPSEDDRSSRGRPSRIHRVTWADLAILVIVLVGMTVAAVAIFNKPSAIYLGQKYQLVVLGFALSIMASCSARQIQKFTLMYEARAGRSTLQNFDALLRSDCLSGAASLGPRLILLFLFCLPLGLSIAYKNFIGGSTNFKITSSSGYFGLTAAPSYQLIGNGLSLLVNVYLPFWSQQALGRTYGFNLYVADNQTAAVLDAPLPYYLTTVQEKLSKTEYIILTAEVNATVTRIINPSDSERNNKAYWDAKRNHFNDGSRTSFTFVNTTQEIWSGSGPDLNNNTEVFVSIANATRRETFESQAERFVSARETRLGTWNITNANITLIEVKEPQSIDQSQDIDQTIIQNTRLRPNKFFFDFIDEYNWESRAYWNQPLAATVTGNVSSPVFRPAINTRPALVASMLWARATSLDGFERPDPPVKTTRYWKDSNSIEIMKTVMTLRRSPWLILIIVINPVLTILATTAKVLLHTTPISDNFGIISMLAGFKGDDSGVLQRAALSGKLTKDVKISFNARDCGLSYERIEVNLGSHEKSVKLHPDKLYG